MELLIYLLILLIPLALGLVVGGLIQRRHLAELAEHEAADASMPVSDVRTFVEADPTGGGEMLLGSVVIGADHFRVFLAGFRKIFGGQVRSYSLVLLRARREALARLREQARDRGYNAIANVRYETAILAFGRGAVMVEALAYGSAYRSRQGPETAA